MPYDTNEFLLHARLDAATLEIWIEEGWLVPGEGGLAFHESDLARVQLIRDLMDDLGVNPEGVGVILNLVDQVHGLRSIVAELVRARILSA